MPLLDSRKPDNTAALISNRAAQIQLDMIKHDIHAGRDTFSRSTDSSTSLLSNSTRSSTQYPRPDQLVDPLPQLPRVRPAASSDATSLLAAPDNALRTACGNPVCKGRWTPPWRSRRYPFFEGRWACSHRCLLAMVKLSLARLMDDGPLDRAEPASDGAAQHRHRVPLGLIMLSQGWITHPQLRKALDMQRLKGTGRIGDWLVSECGLRSEWVTRGLSVQWNCPVLTTEGFSPETMARAVPRPFIEEYGILPVRVAGRKILYVGFQDHLDASSAFAVEQISGLRTECGVVNEERFRKAKESVLSCRFVDMKRTVVSDRDALARSMERAIDQQKPTSSRLVRLHKYFWLRLWHEDEGRSLATRQIPAPGEAFDHLFTIGS